MIDFILRLTLHDVVYSVLLGELLTSEASFLFYLQGDVPALQGLIYIF